MTVDNLLHLANNSGGVLYVIAAMLFVALTIIIERSWFLQRASSGSRAVLDQVDRLEQLNAASLTACAEQFQALPMASLLKVAGRLAGQTSRDELDACLDEAIMREAPNIDRFLWVLDTIVTLAPLLGLFGTIVGMFNAFQVLSNPGNAPTQVTGGVAEALIATASGLFVAMIGLVFFNGLHNRVRGVVHQLETVKAVLVNRLAARAHESLKPVHEVPRPVVGKFASQGV
ncbi:MotA/TolQ/ExbB proton channel family protein [Paraburkholderia tuberum]|uniref:Outer membrane transport energization protein ExbB n=1 Tax=Paraburkholderia tuberum TaxID=157910 RepID=A0A1H1ERZ0_9BURK|nr:MotA/TolQ/ExbB proton channel family protein [Paraburkholderia tuberum]SDQ91517.1 outer membrane transport energization protein ExbB [Paraburkholderia tuberum]